MNKISFLPNKLKFTFNVCTTSIFFPKNYSCNTGTCSIDPYILYTSKYGMLKNLSHRSLCFYYRNRISRHLNIFSRFRKDCPTWWWLCDLLELGKAAFPNLGISLSWPLSSSRPSSMSGWSREPFELKVRLARRVEMYCPAISEFSTKLTLSETSVRRAAVTAHSGVNIPGHLCTGASPRHGVSSADELHVDTVETDTDHSLL